MKTASVNVQPAPENARSVRTFLPTSAEHLLHTGVLNNWYMCLPSADLGANPVGLRRLGRDLVFWRSADGNVNVLDDVCPHRAAPLSLGFVANGDIVCPYHGFCVDGRGVITQTPPTPDSPIRGRRGVNAYPAIEQAGGIWVYFGDPLHQEPPPLELPEELTDPSWSYFLYATVWNCHYLLAMDNRVDPLHGVYLHGDSTTLSRGARSSRLLIEETADGFVLTRDNQHGINLDRQTVYHTPGNNFWAYVDVPYPAASGGGTFRISGYSTPIDDNRTFVWFYRSRKCSGWERDLWRYLYKERLGRLHHEVAVQDEAVLTRIGRNYEELLIQADVGVVRLRRLIREEAIRQFDALIEHGLVSPDCRQAASPQ